MFRHLAFCAKLAISILIVGLAVKPAHAQLGILFPGAGAVNRSMGGASTAAPIDASGALYWNPATMSGLCGSSIDIGVELLYPQTRLASSFPPSAFGPGIPPIAVAGSDRGDDGVFAVPSMALVYQPDGSMLSYGLGVFVVGGFGVNYRTDPTNPILSAQPPNGLGLGPLYSNFQAIEMTPNIAWQISDRFSVGFGPTLTMDRLQATPFFVAPPNANGSFPSATDTRSSWGGGFQVGAFYKLPHGFNLGLSYKSTQWMEPFHFQSADNLGKPRDIAYTFNLPGVVSFGVGYTGLEHWTFAADFRYVDYGHTQGFQQSGFNPDGSAAGLGWRSVFAMSLGVQYQVTECFSARVGYTYNQDPITSEQSSFNVASPTVMEHTIYLGFSYRVTDALSLSAAYFHCFQNSVEGPFVSPAGPIPGSSIRSTTSADSFILGATVRSAGGRDIRYEGDRTDEICALCVQSSLSEIVPKA